MAAYLVKKSIRMLGTGLERQPGQSMTDADFRTCPGWKDALLAEGAIVEYAPIAPIPATVKENGFGEMLMPAMTGAVEEYDIPVSPAEERRKKRGGA